MSLLLDARKKSQQAQSAQQGDPASRTSESGLPDHLPGTRDQARSTGQNLFAAKSLPQFAGYTLPNRNFLYALGGTILLFSADAVYSWSLDSASNATPLRPVGAQPARQFAAPDNSAAAPPAPQNAPVSGIALMPGIALVAGITGQGIAGAIQEHRPIATAPVAITPNNRAPASPDNNPIHIKQQKTEPVDPLLMDAYLAYRNGKLDEAWQLYLAMFKKDARQPDALLGLAAIAQQRGENRTAAQFFGRVLALDPRNAVANAGMSALSADDAHNESRLKNLLREQGNSTALHFALGNLYAGQSRWGEAQQAYFNAYTLESGNAEFAFNLAVSLDHLGQKKLAAQHYRRAIQLDPSHSAGFDHTQISQRAQELTGIARSLP